MFDYDKSTILSNLYAICLVKQDNRGCFVNKNLQFFYNLIKFALKTPPSPYFNKLKTLVTFSYKGF